MKFFKKKNRSLRTRLSVIFGLLVFAICVATTALATFGAGNSLNKQIDELQEQRVMNITSEISTQVMKMQQSLEQIGRNPLFGQKNATKTTYEQIGSMMTKEEENTSFDAIKFVTAEGLVLTDGSPSIKDKDYFKKAMNGEFSISGIVEVGGSEVINFIAPVKDKDDKVTGAIAGIFSREELNSVFADVKYNFLVMNKAGELITTNMKSLATEYKNPVTDKDADASIKELHSTMTSGKTGNTKLTINSSEKNISYTQVKNTEWYVATILEQTEVNKPIKNLMYAMIAISAILMVLGSIVTYVFAGFITKSIISLTSHIGEFAGGDFRNPITDKIMILEDEVGVAAHGLEQMRDSLQNMIVGIKQEMQQLSDSSEVLNSNAEQMLGNSSNISEATSQMAAGVENQSVDLVEISQRIDVFGSMIEEIIKSIQDIYEKIQEMSQSAEAGNMIGNTLKDSVTQTGEIFKEVSDSVTDLNEYVSQVSSITVLINEIAGQTNLLALNASIEAARAGEAGKGFAVVADEIRQLADQVKDSSSKIDHLISQIDDKATVMSNNTEQLQSELTKQMEQIQDSIKQYTKIGDEVTHISADILDMNTSAKYIGENKDIIVESVSSVTAVAEEITASTQEVKSSIDVNQQVSNSVRDLAIELSDKTQQVVERLEQFKVEE